MIFYKPLFLIITLLTSFMCFTTYAAGSGCCNRMGGVNYCDSSAGRLVCNNGFYSTCYCTPHAVMNLQLFRGCCMWKGGVVPQNANSPLGVTVCNDGSVSEECSANDGPERVASW